MASCPDYRPAQDNFDYTFFCSIKWKRFSALYTFLMTNENRTIVLLYRNTHRALIHFVNSFCEKCLILWNTGSRKLLSSSSSSSSLIRCSQCVWGTWHRDWSISCIVTLKLHSNPPWRLWPPPYTWGSSHGTNECAELGSEAMFVFRAHAFKTTPHFKESKNNNNNNNKLIN